ncbi:MAG: ABC transporter permease [Pseudomonadota bacterium]
MSGKLNDSPPAIGTRRFGRVNWIGLATLCERECRRFLAIPTQTVLAPLVTAGLFLLIFDVAFGDRRGEVMGFDFVVFLAPGLMAMSVIQNAFANTSSSLMSAKVMGNIVDTLMPPLSAWELTVGYLTGGIVRGAMIALVLMSAVWLLFGQGIAHPLALLGFIILGSAFMGALGLLAAMQAQKFDQMSALTNFVVTPLAFLSGTFYSVTALPGPLETITRANPFFYAIDGIRWSVLGVSDSSAALAFSVLGVASICLITFVWLGFKTGYRLKA